MEQNLYNQEAEEMFLTVLLQNPELLDEITIDPDMLNPNRNQQLLKTMLDLRSKGIPVEPVSIFERVKAKNIHRVGGIGYISQLAGGMASESSFEYYEDVIREAFQTRASMDIGRQLASGLDPAKALKALTEILSSKPSKNTGEIQTALQEIYNEVVLRQGTAEGILSKYRDLDEMTQGFHKGELTIVAARPSVGKTAFALNIAEKIVGSKTNPDGAIVALFSLEMKQKLLLKRQIASKGNMDMQKMRMAHKEYTEGDLVLFSRTLGMVSETDLRIFDDPADVKYIISKTRELKRQNPGRDIVVMIDYLQLIIGNPIHKANKQAEVGDTSQKLKALALELDIPVIALSQLSRGVEQRQDKRPMMSDLRESGQIEQDADVIMMLYRDDYYDKESEDRNMLEIIIAKQRNGPTGNVKLAFIKEYGKFVTIDFGGSSD